MDICPGDKSPGVIVVGEYFLGVNCPGAVVQEGNVRIPYVPYNKPLTVKKWFILYTIKKYTLERA